MGSSRSVRIYLGWQRAADEERSCTWVICGRVESCSWPDERNDPIERVRDERDVVVVVVRLTFNASTLRRGDTRRIPVKVLYQI